VTDAPRGQSFTAVLSIPVAPEEMEAFGRLHDMSVTAMSAMPGFVSSELLRPVRDGDETFVLSTFDTRTHLEGWLRSAERRHLVELQGAHLLGPRSVNVVGGFAGWFSPSPGYDVVPWRSAVAVLIAIVPVSQLYLGARLWLFPGLDVVVATVVGNVVTVITLTWGLMPPITRLLRGWLHGARLGSGRSVIALPIGSDRTPMR
jgi:antibiotic biosynthesis monooxygenase (ABM) superfamily enzyme